MNQAILLQKHITYAKRVMKQSIRYVSETIVIQIDVLQLCQLIERARLDWVNQIGLKVEKINFGCRTEVAALDGLEQIDAEVDVANVHEVLEGSRLDLVYIVVHQIDELDVIAIDVGVVSENVFVEMLWVNKEEQIKTSSTLMSNFQVVINMRAP